jgi:hypothetical protein
MELRKRSALFVYVATVSSVTATLACSDKTSVAPEAADASRDAETTDRTKDGRAPITVSDSGTKDAARSRAAPDAETDSASPAKDGGPARSDASLLDAGANDSSDAARACPAPADRSKGKACLVFNPEAIRFEAAPELDGKGTLLVRVFDTDVPGPTTHTLAEVVYPPQADGGAREVSVNELPSLEVDGLPETVYVFAVFADNPAYLELAGGLTYGTFVGGLNLASGLQPTPGFRPVSLPAGVGTVVDMKLTAMRRFTSEVTVALDGGAPLGDGEGPLSVGRRRESADPGERFLLRKRRQLVRRATRRLRTRGHDSARRSGVARRSAVHPCRAEGLGPRRRVQRVDPVPRAHRRPAEDTGARRRFVSGRLRRGQAVSTRFSMMKRAFPKRSFSRVATHANP